MGQILRRALNFGTQAMSYPLGSAQEPVIIGVHGSVR